MSIKKIFQGRISRKQYFLRHILLFFISFWIGSIIAMGGDVSVKPSGLTGYIFFELNYIFPVIILFCSLYLSCKRLHDLRVNCLLGVIVYIIFYIDIVDVFNVVWLEKLFIINKIIFFSSFIILSIFTGSKGKNNSGDDPLILGNK